LDNYRKISQKRQITSGTFSRKEKIQSQLNNGGNLLPIYPLLIAIYQKNGRYDEVVGEFKELRNEHKHTKEAYHDT
jgi:hypothetical protein